MGKMKDEWELKSYDGKWRYISALPDAFKDDVVFFHRPWWPVNSDHMPKTTMDVLVYYHGTKEFAVKYYMPAYGPTCLNDDNLGEATHWKQIWPPASQPGVKIFEAGEVGICTSCGHFGPIVQFNSRRQAK